MEAPIGGVTMHVSQRHHSHGANNDCLSLPIDSRVPVIAISKFRRQYTLDGGVVVAMSRFAIKEAPSHSGREGHNATR